MAAAPKSWYNFLQENSQSDFDETLYRCYAEV